jgi:hypothetical protein
MKKFFVTGAFAGALLALATTTQAATVAYDSIPNPLPPNVVSEGFQCCSTAELGDEVALKPKTGRIAGQVTVVMSSWAKHSTYPALSAAGFTHPITLTIYGPSVGLVPGPVVVQKTQAFLLPWRPETSPVCGGDDAWLGSDGKCYHGFASTITFDLRNAGPGGTPVSLPSTLVFGVAYNTNTHGYSPIGLPGPYESLNVGLTTAGPSVGTDVEPGVVFQNADNAYFYTDHGAAGLNVFRKDTGWAPYTPAIAITTYAFAQSKDDCEDNGWKKVVRSDFTPFKNQGACVLYVRHDEHDQDHVEHADD